MDIVRHFLPDVLIIITSVVIFVYQLYKICRNNAENANANIALQIHNSHLPEKVIDVFIFFMFWLCGVVVPSVTSLAYFIAFLLLCLLWSLHIKNCLPVRVLRSVCLVFSAGHILVLYLYQFQSAQLVFSVYPTDTTESLLSRLVHCS